jgi:chemotaxis methyl-accepting protein methylase
MTTCINKLTRTPSQPIQMKYQHPRFTGIFWKRAQGTDAQGNPVYKVTTKTDLFRDFSLFRQLGEFLRERFPEGARIYSYGASDGSEAYSIVIKILEEMTEKAQLYLPIQARDISSEMVEFAKAGQIGIRIKDLLNMHLFVGLKSPVSRYFKRQGIFRHQVQPELLKNVNFQWGDIRQTAKFGFSEKTILFFRNVMYHFPDSDQKQLAIDLFNGMKPGSVIIVGNSIADWETKRRLRQVGFKQVNKHGPLAQAFERPSI